MVQIFFILLACFVATVDEDWGNTDEAGKDESLK
jgi:hypothetical protein